jgi:pimeloyl-ACP methyl ester carboxylesterase
MAMFAVSDPHQLAAAVEHFNLEGVAQRIASPILILHGGSDVQVPLAHAQRLFEEVPHVDKQLIVYPPGQPGCTHCQLDSPLTAHFDILGWLDTFLGSPQLQKERQ